MQDPKTTAWLDQVSEPIVEPDLPIIDPHHHLWERPGMRYVLDDLWADTESGHNVTHTVFVECRASYKEDGPEHLRPVGETEFVQRIAAASAQGDGATIAGIVGHANLALGDTVEEVLQAHDEAGKGLFRGIRHSISRAEHFEALTIPGRHPAGLAQDPQFLQGLRRLGALGYSYDCWLYHDQLTDFAAMADAAPDTTMVLDHFGTPLGVGPYAEQKAEIYENWLKDIAEVAKRPNVVAKIGGMAMPDNGYGWDLRDTPATSDEFVAAQRTHYLHTIEHFGVERCMMESNFPVDKASISYPVLYNALKKIAAGFSAAEKATLFSGTAARVYRLG
ncbi:MAG: amidohydrolase family protein [Pseudomonadota bacterium]